MSLLEQKPTRYEAAPGGKGSGGGTPPPFMITPKPTPPGMLQNHVTRTDGSELFVQADAPVVANTIEAFEGRLTPPTPIVIPPGMQHEQAGPDAAGRTLDVVAEPAIAAEILDRFQIPTRREQYLAETGLRGRWHRSRFGRRVYEIRESEYHSNHIALGILAGILIGGLGVYALTQLNDYSETPSVHRISLGKNECVQAPTNSVAIGYNLSVDGKTLGDDPNAGIAVLFSPQTLPTTHTVCSGEFEAAVDVVSGGPDGYINQVFGDDILFLTESGCIDHSGCGRVIPLRR